MQVLYHSEARWLLRRKMLSRFYKLKTEIATFLSENNSPYAELFDKIWLARVAYLADVFVHLNTLTTSMQGKGHNILNSSFPLLECSNIMADHTVGKSFIQRQTGHVSQCFP